MDSPSEGQSGNYRLRDVWARARRRSGSASYSTTTDTTINTPTSSSFPAGTSLGDSSTAINTPTSSYFGTEASARSPDSRRDRRHSSSSSSSSLSRRPTRQPYECSSCRRYRLFGRLIPVVFCILCIIGAPTFVSLLQDSNWSKSKQGILSGLDSPWPGSTYIITEADSTKALTFTDNGNVKLTRYRTGDVNQIWTCYEADGWLSFGHTATYGSPVYLGYKPWPSDATLHCDAPSARFNEQFEARSRPKGGFQLRLRNGYGLEPLGWSGGTLSRVRRGSPEVWWRFTKVQHPNPLLGVLPVLGDISLVVRGVSLRILEECWQLFLLVLGFVLKTLLSMF
ncbi:hypothetical protein TWF569_011330 [Orbilia oligospora]|uniref:Ricin B lectin domain-containing protein n=1 Tax=Orbilia oligospora TaxID=2813651 RepID=A0A7C8J6H6_ORBOL|nr:hypothetical protein TWF706_002735 [Orbilia oligospora]KAF3097590.1 hypothetical protein TWF103_009521 [Orbilia oligospora]KAF3098125.1 hypothetical protein TWF102_006116 [Orbilia oligospora]KAF3151403.1 hypothetical protein TWF594_007051 [Orbilia oligospora]KAF3154675.1 hypothetical protein TWF569_011330 [Orbilia oligospora]